MLSFVPVAAGVARLSGLADGANGGGVTTENARFVAMPASVVLHILCASLFCALGVLQFDPARRQSFPRLRGIVAALTGLWMTAAYAIPAELQGQLPYDPRPKPTS
jgi:hypothetical protein